MRRLLPIFILLTPIIEIALFIVIGGRIGVLPTLAWIILMAVAGSALIRIRGLSTFRKVNAAINRGETPGPAMLDGALTALAGVMLIIPGFLTDFLGFLLLLPPVRRLVAGRFAWQAMGNFSFSRRPGSRRQAGDDVFDLDPEDYSRNGNPGNRDPDGRPVDRLSKPPGQGL